MLVPAMTEREITLEIWKDCATLHKSTVNRLGGDYHRERKKLNIDPGQTYPRHYSIRTKAKNNWIVFIEKAPATAKYKSENDVVFCTVVYYYGTKGLQVFKPLIATGLMVVYNGHVFTRYNERLQLNLNQQLDIIKRFFTYSGYSHHDVVEHRTRLFSIGVCREGVLLGDYKPEYKWLVNRTFVCRDLYNQYQDETEKELIDVMQKEIATAFEENGNSYDGRATANTLAAITGKRS